MKKSYLIATCVIAILVAFKFALAASPELPQTKSENTVSATRSDGRQNNYTELRQTAFSATPEKLGLSLANDKVVVYGVVMDWEMRGGIATTVSFMTGDASIYMSSGFGVVGGVKHENINTAAKAFTASAQEYLNLASKTDDLGLPKSKEIKFFFLTNKGIYVATEKMENFESKSSGLQELFRKGNDVIAGLRTVSGNR
jgi:hypothetical protein